MEQILISILAPLYFNEGETMFNGITIKSSNDEGDWVFLVEDSDEGYTPYCYYDDTNKRTVSLEDIAELIWADIVGEHDQVENPEFPNWLTIINFDIYVSDGKKQTCLGNSGLFGYQTYEEAKKVFDNNTSFKRHLHHSPTPCVVESSGVQFTKNPSTVFLKITLREPGMSGEQPIERVTVYKLFSAE